jgi:hypothetical protein
VEKVISDVSEHVQEEEGEMFPKFLEAISSKKLEEIGAQLAQAKKKAPTRPHPNAPSTPPRTRSPAPRRGRGQDPRQAGRPRERLAHHLGTQLRVARVAQSRLGCAGTGGVLLVNMGR